MEEEEGMGPIGASFLQCLKVSTRLTVELCFSDEVAIARVLA